MGWSQPLGTSVEFHMPSEKPHEENVVILPCQDMQQRDVAQSLDPVGFLVFAAGIFRVEQESLFSSWWPLQIVTCCTHEKKCPLGLIGINMF
jgi:hypothetical protein